MSKMNAREAREKLKDIEMAEDGCLIEPSSYLLLVDAMNRAIESARGYDDNDTAAILAESLGYRRSEWGEWVIPHTHVPIRLPATVERDHDGHKRMPDGGCELCGADALEVFGTLCGWPRFNSDTALRANVDTQVKPAKVESGDGLPRGVQRINSAVSAIDAMKAKNPLVSDNDAAIVFHEKWQSALEDNERLRGLLRDCEDAATVLAYERATDITGKHYSELSKKIKAAVTGEQP